MFLILSLFPVAAQTLEQVAAIQKQHHVWGYLGVSWNANWTPVPVSDVAKLEYQLGQNAED
jgi:hypothetical protein